MQCPSAASHNPTATCRRWNGKIPLAKLAGPFGKAQLWVNRLCGAPPWRSRFVFIPILYPADSCRPACPCGAAAGSAGRRPKRRVNIGVPEKGLRSRSSSFAASLLLLRTGGESYESARRWGQRGPGTQTMSPSCHRHAGAPAAGVSPSQGLADGGFALSGCTSAVFAGGLADPLRSPLLPPAELRLPRGQQGCPGGVCAHISATPSLLVLGPGHQRSVRRGLIFLLHCSSPSPGCSLRTPVLGQTCSLHPHPHPPPHCHVRQRTHSLGCCRGARGRPGHALPWRRGCKTASGSHTLFWMVISVHPAGFREAADLKKVILGWSGRMHSPSGVKT